MDVRDNTPGYQTDDVLHGLLLHDVSVGTNHNAKAWVNSES